jgi:AbrB family looped-hinge helix DNA binding protein
MTITSKFQITLPAKLLRQLGWKPPIKVQVEDHSGRILLSPVAPASAKRKPKEGTSP